MEQAPICRLVELSPFAGVDARLRDGVEQLQCMCLFTLRWLCMETSGKSHAFGSTGVQGGASSSQYIEILHCSKGTRHIHDASAIFRIISFRFCFLLNETKPGNERRIRLPYWLRLMIFLLEKDVSYARAFCGLHLAVPNRGDKSVTCMLVTGVTVLGRGACDK